MTGEEKNKSLSEIIFFSVALSVAIVIITGTTVNFILPKLGVDKPISIIPLWVTFNMLVILLILVSYLKKRPQHSSELNLITKYQSFTKIDLFFSLLPTLSLLSAYIFSHYENNIGLLVLYVIIGITSIIFANSEQLKFNTTYAIWCVGMSLLLSTVFGVSWDYIWGWDITGEYYSAHKVIEKGIWDTSLYDPCNTVASVNILAPVYSVLLNLDLVWIFKIVYPLIFSLVPVILFKAYEVLLKDKAYSSLAVLYFMLANGFFFQNIPTLARHMIVEVYLAILVYALIKRINSVFLLLSAIALAMSHYGTAYLTMCALLSILIVYAIKQRVNEIIDLKISPIYVAIFWIFTLLWYMYVGGGFQFENLVNIGYETSILLEDLFDPYSSQGLYLIVSERSTITQQFVKFVGLAAQAFIVLGVVYTVINLARKLLKKTKIYHLEFYAVSLVFFLYDVSGVILPFFSNRLNVTRLYHLTLFFISPYLVVGFLQFIQLILGGVGSLLNSLDLGRIPAKRYLTLFIVIYFLSTSGWLYTVTGEKEVYFLSKKADQAYWSLEEVYGTKWIAEYKDDLIIHSDVYRALLIRSITGQNYNWGSINGERENMEVNIPKKGYLYLGQRALKEKVLVVKDWEFKGTIRENFKVSINDPKIFKVRVNSLTVYSSNNVMIHKIIT